MPFIFGGKKLPFWVRKKPSYYFRKANISCKLRGIPFPTIFNHLNFELPHPNRSNNIVNGLNPGVSVVRVV